MVMMPTTAVVVISLAAVSEEDDDGYDAHHGCCRDQFGCRLIAVAGYHVPQRGYDASAYNLETNKNK